MSHQTDHSPGDRQPLRLRSKAHPEPISPETPRFHFFLIDTGWNGPVSKVLRSQLPLFQQYNPHDPLYLLTHEQSARILRNAPEHIGLDPIVVVYDLLRPGEPDPDGVEN